MFNYTSTDNRFTLEKYKGPGTRHTCPNCGKRKEFSRYVDVSGSISFPEYVGKCNREINCGYHYPPRQYFIEAGISFGRDGNIRNPFEPAITPRKATEFAKPKPQPEKRASFMPADVFRGSLKDYDDNNLACFLNAKLGRELTESLIGRYFIGTSKYWPGATVFWQVDSRGNIRGGKAMLYNPETGRRDKTKKATWAHAVLKWPDFQLEQCFFGEHLLALHPGKAVAIVESEKTAMIASAYLESLDLIWLASGGLGMLKADRCKVLQGRQVVLYPDAGKPATNDGKTPFEKWKIEADVLNKSGIRVSVSDLLETGATQHERETGFDLADYLLRFEIAKFKQEGIRENSLRTRIPAPESNRLTLPDIPHGYSRERFRDRKNGQPFEVLVNADGYPADWDMEQPQGESLARVVDLNPVVKELIERFDLELTSVKGL